MKLILQRVKKSSVSVGEKICGESGVGFCILAGMESFDTKVEIQKMAQKIATLRVFADENGKMNKSLLDIGGSILLVSQFTLLADCNTGRRPSFSGAGNPQQASALFDMLVEELKQLNIPVQTGIFGADMLVCLENDGPATFILESKIYANRK